MTSASQSSQVLLTTESRIHSRLLLKGFLIYYAFTVLSLAAAGKVWSKAGFDLVVVGMGWPHLVLGFAGACAYQVQQVSSNLAYGFDLKYFMCFLVFQVTTSLAPESTRKPILQNGFTNPGSVVA